jgi:hypothetical protein
MKITDLKVKNITFYLKIRINLVSIIISLISLLFILLKILNFNNISGISEIPFLNGLFLFFVYLSTIYTLLFLPTYPLFFIVFKEKNLNFLEKLSITTVANLSFYIILGIFGFYLGFSLTEWFFFIVLIFFFFAIVFWILIHDIKSNKYNTFKLNLLRDDKKDFIKNFSIVNMLRRIRFSNSVLLVIFIFLLCVFAVFGTSIFIGTDPWMHISIIKFITDINYLPPGDYFGTYGFHVFGALIHFFSGMEIILIPRFFIFYTFPITALLVYNIFMRIFKNKNLAIFGIFVLGFSSLGFLNLMFQYWPSSLALIQGTTMFFLLYIRLQSSIKEKEPQWKEIYSNMIFSYFLFICVYVSCIFVHSLIAMIFLFTYLWVFLIYFFKSYRRGFDLFLLCICLGIFIIFYILDISTGHLNIILAFITLPWYYIIFGIIVLGVFEGLILLHYRKSMVFTKGRFSSILAGEKNKIFKKIEEKILFPLILSLALILAVSFSLANYFLFKFEVLAVFNGLETILICSFAIWGLLLFQYKPRGKPLFLWGFAFGIILIIGILYDFVTGTFTFSSRIFYLSSIVISIGFVSYFYKLIKTKSIHNLRIKVFLLGLVTFSLVVTNFEAYSSFEFYSLKRREVNILQWYSNYSPEPNVVIGEFGWSSIIIFYNYPFENKNASLPLNSVLFFEIASNEYLNPNQHIQNNTNVLKELKKSSRKEVYLILTDSFLLISSLELFGRLTPEEKEMYYNLNYLNKVCSTKTENGNEVPLYWVI